MRYLVKARVKPKREEPLLNAIGDKTLGKGSIAGDEYVYNMEQARVNKEGLPPGSRPAFAIHRWLKNDRTGRNTSSC
jgi:hypothetical protein